MERYRWQIHLQQTQILNDKSIHPDFIKATDEVAGRLQFFVVEYGIDGYIDFGVELMGKTA